MSTLESVEPDPNQRPRIICTRCPAVAVVHHHGRVNDGRILVWAECHGEHRFGALPHLVVREVETTDCDILFSHIHAYTDADLELTMQQSEARATE